MSIKEKWRLYQNYVIIGILSLISVFFLPMLGTEVGLAFKVPDTFTGICIWFLTKLCIVAINMMLLDQFIKQAKVNIKDNERFIEADLYYTSKYEEEEYLPLPKEYLSKLYKNKGITSSITSALSVFGLTSAILTFDWVSMLTYLFTIVFGIIFGWITMNNVEEYWTVTYYRRYLRDKAKDEKAKRDLEMAERKCNNKENDCACDICRITLLDTSICTCDNCTNNKSLVVDNNGSSDSLLGGTIHACDTTSNSINAVNK